jgi:hypothetical protein
MVVAFYGYDDCLELASAHARVVITPHGGARILLYALQVEGAPNAIHLDDGTSGKFESGDDAGGEKPSGWKWVAGQATGDPFGPTGGRFDVGPEFQAGGPDMRQGGHPALFFGSWAAEQHGALAATLTSPICERTGLQITRQFALSAECADLSVTQTCRNAGAAASLRVNHWGRTFVPGGGIALVPLPEDGYSRFPEKYVVYEWEPQGHIIFQPGDEHIRVRENFVEIVPHVRGTRQKIGFDSPMGWFGYLSPAGQLLVKRFEVDQGQLSPERVCH